MDVKTKNKQGVLSGFFKKRNAAHPSAALLADLAAAAGVFLLARTHLLFGAYPLGIALLASLRGFSVIAGLIGGLLSVIGMGSVGYIYASLLIITVCMRLIVSIPGGSRRVLPDSAGIFKEMPQLRAAISCIVGFAAALYQLLVAGPTTGTLLFSATMLIAPTVAVLLFSGVLDAGLTVEELLGKPLEGGYPDRTRGDTLRLSVGALALGFFLSASLAPFSLLGLSLAYLFASAVTLYVSRRLGALYASVFGMFITLGVAPLYAPALAVLGLLSGALWEMGGLYALSLGVAGGALWASYVGQLSGFLSVAPELVIASLFLAPSLASLGSDETVRAERARSEAGRRAIRRFIEEREAEQDSALTSLSDSLRGLSESLHSSLASLSEPDLSDYRHAVSCAAAPHCSVCPRRLACAGRDAAENTIAEHLLRGEAPDTACLDATFVRDCGSIGVILADARSACSELRSDGKYERMVSALSTNYALLADLVADAAERDRARQKGDPSLAKQIKEALAERGVEAEAAAVYGQRQRRIVVGGAMLGGASVSSEELRRTLEELCSCRLAPLSFEQTGESVTLSTESVCRYRAETCRAYRAAESGEVSGDTVTFFDGRDGVLYGLLSDGMGRGRRAAATSGVAALFLSRLLSAGCSKSTALKLLNNLLRLGGEESSATVDLLELDLLTGRATFIKSGAAPSYVKRGDNLFRIRSKTVSVGMTESLDAEKIRFEAEPGDLIVMLSDGVSQTPEDAPWLMELLAGELEDDLSAVAERIVGIAAGTHERRDDMTVALIRVFEPEAPMRSEESESAITEVLLPAENEGVLEAAC